MVLASPFFHHCIQGSFAMNSPPAPWLLAILLFDFTIFVVLPLYRPLFETFCWKLSPPRFTAVSPLPTSVRAAHLSQEIEKKGWPPQNSIANDMFWYTPLLWVPCGWLVLTRESDHHVEPWSTYRFNNASLCSLQFHLPFAGRRSSSERRWSPEISLPNGSPLPVCGQTTT